MRGDIGEILEFPVGLSQPAVDFLEVFDQGLSLLLCPLVLGDVAVDAQDADLPVFNHDRRAEQGDSYLSPVRSLSHSLGHNQLALADPAADVLALPLFSLREDVIKDIFSLYLLQAIPEYPLESGVHIRNPPLHVNGHHPLGRTLKQCSEVVPLIPGVCLRPLPLGDVPVDAQNAHLLPLDYDRRSQQGDRYLCAVGSFSHSLGHNNLPVADPMAEGLALGLFALQEDVIKDILSPYLLQAIPEHLLKSGVDVPYSPFHVNGHHAVGRTIKQSLEVVPLIPGFFLRLLAVADVPVHLQDAYLLALHHHRPSPKKDGNTSPVCSPSDSLRYDRLPLGDAPVNIPAFHLFALGDMAVQDITASYVLQAVSEHSLESRVDVHNPPLHVNRHHGVGRALKQRPEVVPLIPGLFLRLVASGHVSCRCQQLFYPPGEDGV